MNEKREGLRPVCHVERGYTARMLRFLIMHVRGTANRHETPPSAVASKTADSSPGECDASDSSLPSNSQEPTAVAATSSSPKSVVPSQVMDCGTLLLLLACCILHCGCACLQRDKKEAAVVGARQLSLKGIDALESGKWDEAEALFADALRKNPADERAHRHYAEVMWKRGQQQAAIHHMEKSVRFSGGDPQLLVQLGEMYLGQGNSEAAWECAKEAIEANDNLASAWALQGDIYRSRGEWDQALESYHRALAEQPHYPQVQLATAAVYREQNRPQRALATLNSLASQYRPHEIPPDILLQQGLAYKALGRYQDAVGVLTLASRQNATADLLYELGEAQHLAGNSANARLALQAALDRAPGHQPSLRLQETITRQNRSLTASIDSRGALPH